MRTRFGAGFEGLEKPHPFWVLFLGGGGENFVWRLHPCTLVRAFWLFAGSIGPMLARGFVGGEQCKGSQKRKMTSGFDEKTTEARPIPFSTDAEREN